MPLLRLAAAALLTLGLTGAVYAQQQPFRWQLEARKGQFNIMTMNLGVLGSMARGDTEYDADMATLAATNIVTATQIDQTFNWPEGSDNESIEGTLALPAIWENLPDVMAKWQALGEAAVALQAAAGEGREALGPALGALGDSCDACHEDYRQPIN